MIKLKFDDNGSCLYYGEDISGENVYNIDDVPANLEPEAVRIKKILYPERYTFKLNNSENDPKEINYDIRGLHKKRTIVYGELQTIEYFQYYDGITYDDLVVKEHRTYYRHVDTGVIKYRILFIEWYNLLGEVLTSVTFPPKYYNPEETIAEGVDRRTNVINGTKSITLELLGLDYSFDLLTSVKIELDYYINGYTQPLRDAITNSTKPYLTESIKDAIVVSLELVNVVQ